MYLYVRRTTMDDNQRKTLKKIACEAIDQAAEDLYHLSQEIWANPELAYEEFKAHDLLAKYLESTFKFPTVERNLHLKTAWRASYGQKQDGGIHVAVLSEYDALPEIGHACGHNLIAEVGVAAGIGIKAVLEKSSLPCKVRLSIISAQPSGGCPIGIRIVCVYVRPYICLSVNTLVLIR